MDDGFTRDDLERMIENGGYGENYSYGYVKAMAQQLLDEMKNPGVWDGAPEWATSARVRYTDGPLTGHNDMYSQRYDREVPKTKAREIAERKSREWQDGFSIDSDPLADLIEAAIIEAQKDGEK